ncbi:MAG: DUF169 domain-containing protein [Tissierellia bacterium]|nr:DUF169 domain-containing protein [Tissierellia bacterium]MDD4725231.1 DUF169 domain-containing protein [Tissierellia bacterium]
MSKNCKEMNEIIDQYLRLSTFPIAVKLFAEGEELPPRTKVPTKDFGYPIAFCQGVNLARKFGWSVAFYQEDQACPLGQVILGHKEEPEFIKDGSVVYPLYVDNIEAGKKTQASTPKMPKADTHCIVLAPLHFANFEPDVILIYGNGAQITRLVQSALYKEGGYIESRFAGRGACGGEVVVPIVEDRCNVIIPGGGERVFAMTTDEELAFAMPKSKFDDVMEGLVKTHKGGVARIPTPYAGISLKPQFPKYYSDLGDYCGLNDK